MNKRLPGGDDPRGQGGAMGRGSEGVAFMGQTLGAGEGRGGCCMWVGRGLGVMGGGEGGKGRSNQEV